MKDNTNNRIDIMFETIDGKNYVEVDIKQEKLPDNVYDISIDPGHER